MVTLVCMSNTNYASRLTADIYAADGSEITAGLQPSRFCDEAINLARELAAERNETLLLCDDDGDWLVAPDGKCTQTVAETGDLDAVLETA